MLFSKKMNHICVDCKIHLSNCKSQLGCCTRSCQLSQLSKSSRCENLLSARTRSVNGAIMHAGAHYNTALLVFALHLIIMKCKRSCPLKIPTYYLILQCLKKKKNAQSNSRLQSSVLGLDGYAIETVLW